ncbi:MAG: recombinase family protein [Pseudomonadota bacterium]|nr:recombinase family protein [Pseudomonadota bacterium]
MLLRYNIPLRTTSDYRGSKWYAFGKRRVRGTVVEHKGEQHAISAIKKMHAEGMNTSAIARCLNAMKLPTKQQGKAWHHHTVATIIRREGV